MSPEPLDLGESCPIPLCVFDDPAPKSERLRPFLFLLLLERCDLRVQSRDLSRQTRQKVAGLFEDACRRARDSVGGRSLSVAGLSLHHLPLLP